MSTRMLIDARHSEETRVAVVKGNKVEDFDYESSNKVQIKGNIYLAKITRVEPSLQAAFVEYGGNRHGFLAFSEIHPDYYQIPVEDREALLAEEAAIQASEPVPDAETADDKVIEGEIVEASDKDASDKDATDTTDKPEADKDTPDTADKADGETEDNSAENADDQSDDDDNDDIDDEFAERLRLRQLRALKRRYKIQEVIKPRQIILIQVVKEERGNKGAALTSYISLAGRYTVLMPNTTHGGGISRKISNATDRKRLKSIVDSLDIPSGTGCIIRTAGMKRTKTEIKRDVEYIQKIWSNIRALTLKSVAPSMVYEEASLIKRAIRDLYDRSIDEVQVEGDEGFKVAKEFMTLLMPSHAKRVVHYNEGLPLFQRYQVEEQLDGIFDPNVTLKSGGYLVINPTEALISIDVNSGKSTKQHNIESTAFKTNLEAAVEIGRQLRLRDLAGLVVIDFIDMEERSHNRKVESKMKDAIKADRARIMVNRISSLGLMEISRQRLRPNLEEASSEMCPHCEGSGRIRNKESAALHVLRAIENEGYKGRNSNIAVSLNPEVAFYVLNLKRTDLVSLEEKYGVSIELTGDPALISPKYEISSSGAAPTKRVAKKPAPINSSNEQATTSEHTKDPAFDANADEQKPKRRRRRGGRGRGKYGRNRFYEEGEENKDGNNAQAKNADGNNTGDNNTQATNADGKKADGDQSTANASANNNSNTPNLDENGEQKPPRRRGRRGGRRSRYSRGDENKSENANEQASSVAPVVTADASAPANADTAKAGVKETAKPAEGTETAVKKPARRRRKKVEAKTDEVKTAESSVAPTSEKPAAEKPKRKPRVKKAEAVVKTTAKAAPTKPSVDEKAKKPRVRRKTATSKAKDVDAGKTEPKAKAKSPVEKPAKKVANAKTTVAKDKPKTEAKTASTGKDKPKKRGWWQRDKAAEVE